MLTKNENIISMNQSRLEKIAYFTFVDLVTDAATDLHDLAGEIVEVGGLQTESGVSLNQFNDLFTSVADRVAVSGGSIDVFASLVEASEVFEQT